jgi:membrane-bound lytic murein transglycosylase B
MPATPARRRRRRGPRFTAFVVAGLLVVAGIVFVFILPNLDVSGRRIPSVALAAYRAASRAAPTIRKGCSVEWEILAALAKVESDHGRINGPRTIANDGTIEPPIIGPPLDGTGGTRAIVDTDKGKLDGDTHWDHAVGPLQFIPSTWRELGRDGNGDGRKDPNNLYDAALTAAAHLCLREPGDYRDRVQLRRSLIAYNQSNRYADEVLAWIDTYRAMPADELTTAAR